MDRAFYCPLLVVLGIALPSVSVAAADELATKDAAPRLVINSFHVGNSLTGNAVRFRDFARTAGIENRSSWFLIGGAYTVKLWKAKEGPDKQRFAKEYAKAAFPLDHFTLQPRDFNLDEEVESERKFIDFVRQKSPDVQPWLYAEWVERDRRRPSDKGVVPSYQMKKTFPAATWEESMSAMLLYVEEVQHRLNAQNKEGASRGPKTKTGSRPEFFPARWLWVGRGI